jgi:PAS domain S-box-containing protein
MADHLRDTLDHLLEGFQVVDRDFRYVYVNPAAAKHGESTPEALVGRKMTEAYPGIEATALFRALTHAMEDRVPISMDNLFTLPSGDARWFELRIVPVPEGVCVHSVDIHERKMAEAELRQLTEQLEARVEDRTRDLESFSYSVSHDLRAPLRAIDGFARMLEEEAADRLDDAGRGHLARIRAAADRMDRAIEAMLTLAVVTRSIVERKDVDITALARAVVAELDRADGFAIEDGLEASCDPALARIVLENLLSNAAKFTAKTPQPVITLRRSAHDAQTFVLTDNGVGFDPKRAGQLFAPFSRLHASRDFTGTGIGLATVKRIVQRHGGTVHAAGEVGRGATITFSFGD